MLMLNTMFMFHYQLDQNTDCKVKFVVNMSRHCQTTDTGLVPVYVRPSFHQYSF